MGSSSLPSSLSSLSTLSSTATSSQSSAITTSSSSLPSSPIIPAPKRGRQPLILLEAIQNGHITKALELLQEGANANETDPTYGWTPLHLAARDGKGSLATLLLQHGASVDARDFLGQTPLHRAAFWGKLELVNLLLDHGADFTSLDHMLQTPEELATHNGHVRVVEVLQQAVMLFLENGLSLGEEHLERMRQNVHIKEREEKRRKGLWQQAKKKEQQQERRDEKIRQHERKLRKKQEELTVKAAELEDEIAHVMRSQPRPGTKEALRLKLLQTKQAKVASQLEEHRLKARSFQAKSLQEVPLTGKGDAWIAFINSHH